jgi:hypothetical protein
MQNLEVQERSRKGQQKRKTYVETNGRVHDTLQGYEPQVLEWLNTVKGVENFVTRITQCPRIQVKDKYYSPDARFQYKGKKYLLEVKSDHTLLDDWTLNLKKFRMARLWCEENGYTFLFALSDGSTGKPIFVKNPKPVDIKAALKQFW